MALLWEVLLLDVVALGVTGGLVRRTDGRSFGPGFALGAILAVLVLALIV